mmetsp:Transcript_15547/g.29318  ORF Transcript_15547/g.29318 Transcript_15547/m.29318 type:complete len:312 (-) Transcript_15547:5824-6759(-)
MMQTQGHQTITNNDTSSSSLPFMEIREEFDQYGNEIKAEVMNMSKVVQNVKKEIESKKENSESKSHGMLDALLQSIPESTDMHQSRDFKQQEEQQQSSSLRRQRFDISARLDELIRLEEEAESRKELNRKSSKKIQGSGWKKGFLSKKKQPSSTASKQTPQLKSSSKSSSSDTSSKSSLPQEAPRVKKVQINEMNNDVKQIPRRISGTRPMSSSSIDAMFPADTKNASDNKDTTSSPTQNPIMMNTMLQNRTNHDEIFTFRQPRKTMSMGGIIERLDANSISDQTNIASATSSSNDTGHLVASSDSKKKLS